MRPLIVRGVRTMLIDAGIGDKEDAKFARHLRLRSRATPRSRAGRGRARRPRTSTSCSPRTCISITPGDSPCADASRPCCGRGFRARNTSCGEASGTTRPIRTSATAASYLRDELRAARRSRRAGSSSTTIRRSCRASRCSAPAGTQPHHQMRLDRIGRPPRRLSSADLIPTTAHLPNRGLWGSTCSR